MNTELAYTIIAINCTITSIMIAYNMGNRKNESSIWWLESRVKTLEKELSCLRTLVNSDQLNKANEEFEEKLNEK